MDVEMLANFRVERMSFQLALTFTACLFIPTLLLIYGQEEHCVDINHLGTLCGTYSTVLDKKITNYFSVPFAEPPINDLRFLPPKKLESFPGNRVSSHNRKSTACPQVSDESIPGFEGTEMWNSKTGISEDCLYMNIWAPEGAQNVPVMIWIFGGGFVTGSPSLDIYDGEAMAAAKDVIVVNLNYRLGFIGFAYLNDPLMPGNMGLLDQRMAIEWVVENIHHLGGDAGSITLFGESAGAASVSAHVLAPESRKLFQAAIMESGTILSPWATNTPERAHAKSEAIAEKVGCPIVGDTTRTIQCLRNVSWQKLIDGSSKLEDLLPLEFVSVPVNKDPNFFGGQNVLDLLESQDFSSPGKYILGFNADEGAVFLPLFLPEGMLSQDSSWSLNRIQYIDASYALLKDKPDLVQKAAIFEYENSEFGTFINSLDEMAGDLLFVCPLLKFARKLSKSAPGSTRLYFFNYVVSTNPWPREMGVLHAYEIELAFGQPLVDSRYSDGDRLVSRMMVDRWTGLLKGGPIFDQWTPITPDYWSSLAIDLENANLASDPKRKLKYFENIKNSTCGFWKMALEQEKADESCRRLEL